MFSITISAPRISLISWPYGNNEDVLRLVLTVAIALQLGKTRLLYAAGHLYGFLD
jgi:hypothetical protein